MKKISLWPFVWAGIFMAVYQTIILIAFKDGLEKGYLVLDDVYKMIICFIFCNTCILGTIYRLLKQSKK